MTIPEYIFQTCDSYPNQLSLAMKHERGFKGISYRELKAMSIRFASELLVMGVKKGDAVVLFSENRPEWVIADLGIQYAGGVTVPIHSVFQLKYIQHVIRDVEARYLVISDSHLYEKLHEAHADLGLHKIIYFSQNKIFGHDDNFFFYFNDLIHPKTNEPSAPVPLVDENDLATIIYTSGTTGMPKGVELTHANILSNSEAIHDAIDIQPSDRFLSVLLLSHCFERTAGLYVPLSRGAKIFYTHDIKELAHDLKRVKPTILIGVPRVFEKAYEKIHASKLFNRIHHLPFGKKLIRVAIKKRFGGKIRFCVSGGAALDPTIGNFFHSYGVTILEGFGLTETAPVISCNRLNKNKFGTCGIPLKDIDVKIAMDGELLIKGQNVMKGYHNLKEATNESFTSDGYFKTGDIALIDEQGFLKITGRKKNIIVLSTGKNVQPEEIESALDANPYIAQSVVIGDGRKMVTALIVPEREMFALEGVHSKEDMHPIIQREINAALAHFPEHEQIKKFTLIFEPFSIDTDELTPTLKLKRKVIQEHYKKEIDALYA